jgi:glycosyltransferase involved in cell wall biosynthesis
MPFISNTELRTWVRQMNAGLDRRPLDEQLGRLSDKPTRPALKVMFFTHYFPPEGNAPASRVHEICKRWVRAGCRVIVVTGVPNAPDGVIYPGYVNKFKQTEGMDGIRVVRVWTYLAANRGMGRRSFNFISYMLTAAFVGMFLDRPDVIIATSPQFFCGWAGVLVRRFRRIPFILEIRDIWPESITTVGAMKHRNPVIRLLESMEQQMYRAASHIVTVGEGYKQRLMERNVRPEEMTVITNGVDRELFVPREASREFLSRYNLHGKFVAAYVGTIGMASGLAVVLRAATLLKDRGRNDITILLVGDGAIRAKLQKQAQDESLDNVVFTGKLDKQMMPDVLASVNACLVHLKKQDLFESVLPSKIFEAAGMKKPILLGVRGHAERLVRDANAGICIEPENEQELVDALIRLADDPGLCAQLGNSGHEYVLKHFDRDELSSRYLDLLKRTVRSRIALREKRWR